MIHATVAVGCLLLSNTWATAQPTPEADSFVSIESPLAKAPAIDFTRFDDRVTPLLERMTLAEKIGQMTQAELSFVEDLDELAELGIGSVLSGGGSDPAEGNTVEAWTSTYNRCQKAAMSSRLGIPILYGIDAVHGHNNVLGATIFPHNIGLGCTNNPALVERVAEITALEVRATGIQWTFAPCVTVPRDDRWGRTYEGFGEEPEIVTRLGEAAVRGLQGDDLASPHRVLGCAKHFAGDGGTTAEVAPSPFGELDPGSRLRLDRGDTRCDEATFRRIHIRPYLDAIASGVGSVMPSYSSWNGVKCTGNKWLLTDLLKQELGFEGFVISDYSAIDEVHEDYREAIAVCINAGIDMAMVPDRHKEFHRLLVDLVEQGEVPMTRIDDAVRRILRVKAAMGLLDKNRQHLADKSLRDYVGAADHRRVAREAVRQSLVLLKNEGNVLPIRSSAKRVVVCGSGANDLGRQCGGWTIDWQGKEGDVTPGGVTIFNAIKQAAEPQQEVALSTDGADAAAADLAIVVVSEAPYAEGLGDASHPRISENDKVILQRAAESSTPIVLVVLSGRPIDLGSTLDHADAVVAAWLPGTNGHGVADVLTGAYSPTGKLSFSWPASGSWSTPVNVGQEGAHPQFAFGEGLTYPE